MSSNWSFGSRSRPCSQSRKISIGIMVDSLTKKGSECSRKYKIEAMDLPKMNSKLGNGAPTKLQQEEGSPWVKPRSNCRKSVISEGDSKLGGDKRSKDKTSSKLDKLKGPAPEETIKFFRHNASFFTSKGTEENRLDGQKNSGEINQSTDAMEKNLRALDQGVLTADKPPAGDQIGSTVNKRSENLRMKLCELMGNVFSPEKEQASLPPVDVGDTSLQPEPNINQANDVCLWPRPSSDTIETDSENPGGSKRRPVCRSIKRKRARKKATLKKIDRVHWSARKDELKESDVHLFGEGCKVAQSSARKKSSCISKQKNRIPTTSTKSKETQRKFTRAEPRRISFPLEVNEEKLQEASREENSFSAGRLSAHGVRTQSSSSSTMEKVGKNARPETVVTEKDPLEQLLERNLDGGKDINIAKLTENFACGNRPANTSALKKSADRHDYFVSPTIGRRAPLTSSSPGSSCKDDRTKQGKPSAAEAMFNLEKMFTSWNFNSKDTPTKQREQPDAGNDESDSQDSAASDSDSSEGRDIYGLGKDTEEEKTLSPEVVTWKKPNSELHRAKRFHGLGDTKPYDRQPVLRSSKGKGTGTTAWKQASGEFRVQDEFSRAIGPLAMSLEKIKSKLKLVTAHKSSEILNSLAAKIQAQMQNVESQVQSDMGKLKHFSKRKRKFLKRDIQDHEKQLKSINERFKKELSQHVQHCIETTEGMEENKIELEKMLEKQKASHRKLLMQVEQAAQNEIQVAEKRISNVNKLAREQMLQLRLLIEQYLGEGVQC